MAVDASTEAAMRRFLRVVNEPVPSPAPRPKAAEAGPEVTQRFVDWMDALRKRERLRHGVFAERFGMDRSYWYLLRRGRRRASMNLVQRVLAEHPEARAALGPGGPSRPPDPDTAARAAFTTYLLAEADVAGSLGPADLRRWWHIWQAAWRAAREP